METHSKTNVSNHNMVTIAYPAKMLAFQYVLKIYLTSEEERTIV